MQNYVENMRCSLFLFQTRKTILGQIWSKRQKDQNCQFKLKFGSKTNLDMPNSMMMFTCFAFDHTYLPLTNLVQKFKIVCSKWNLIKRLIQICKIQWFYLFYLLYTENSYPFWANLVQKIAFVSLSWKLVLRLIRIWKIQWCSFFSAFERKYTIFWKFVPKTKIVCWS